MSDYFVLVGAPGTGKTSVLNWLRDQGFVCYSEAARFVLEQQLAVDGQALPSKNPLLFIQTMQKKQIDDFDSGKSAKAPVFYDRGMPDLVHYAIRFGVPSGEFEAVSQKYRYNKNVFLLPPWKEIYTNDEVRPLPFETTAEIHELLVNVYKSLDYNLISVPTGSVDFRANFILAKIKSM